MRSPLPLRPRLADHVLARRHVLDGEDLVLLHDLTTGRVARIGAREWGLLLSADGTRDLEGIVVAAAREGAHASVSALRAFLEQLAAADLLGSEDAPDGDIVPARRQEPDASNERPLDPLPGYLFSCDGRGGCCRFYATVVFSPLEEVRARALMPLVLEAGEDAGRAFTPERGARSAGRAVASVDGRCAYLESSGRCAVHAAGGISAKPLGCQVFPARFVDDGESVRVSVAVECACVLASVGRTEGAPLVGPGARRRRDLDARIDVTTLAEGVIVAQGMAATRAEIVAWSRDLVGAEPPRDPIAAAWSLADRITRTGLARVDGAAWRWPEGAPPPAVEALAPLLRALADTAEKRARKDAGWSGDRLPAGRAVLFIHAAATALLEDGLCSLLLGSPPAHAGSEAFYLRALLHGHELVGPLSLADALRDRAVRMLVARALPLAYAALDDDGADPALRHPLAVVEATLRGHGLGSYFPGS